MTLLLWNFGANEKTHIEEKPPGELPSREGAFLSWVMFSGTETAGLYVGEREKQNLGLIL